MTPLLQKQGSLGFKKKSYGASSVDINLFHPLFPRALHSASSPSVSKSGGGFPWPWCQHSTEPLKQTSSIVVVVKCSIEQIREERRSWMWQHGVVTYISGRCT